MALQIQPNSNRKAQDAICQCKLQNNRDSRRQAGSTVVPQFIEFYIQPSYSRGRSQIIELRQAPPARMEVENYRAPRQIKSEQVQVKNEGPQANIHYKLENLRKHEPDLFVDINSEASGEEANLFKQERNEVIERRPRTVDLSKEILNGIVVHCRRQGLISDELAHCFFTNFTTKMAALYIEYYKSNQLHRFNFAKCKINIIDHRRLVEMLIQHNKAKYFPPKPEGPYDFLKEGQQFLREIYKLPLEEYQSITEEQVSKYYQSWWGGPENTNPTFVEPVVEVLDVEEAARQFEELERIKRKEREQAEQERLLRVSEQRPTSNDLLDIANRLSSRLFGTFYPSKEPEIKIEESAMTENPTNSDQKRKKQKEEKQSRKQKKEKKKSKKKKSKTEAEIKEQYIEEIKLKKEAQMRDERMQFQNSEFYNRNLN